MCHADEYNNATVLLSAVGCSRVWVSPAGGVDAVGISAQMLYAARLLHRLHVTADFLQVGKYKGAEEPFTREGPSPEARASLEQALGGMRQAWLDAITQGRKPQLLPNVPEEGPYAPDEALANGLIDAVGDAEDALDDAKRLAGADHVMVRFGGKVQGAGSAEGLVSILRWATTAGAIGVPHIALLVAHGPISLDGAASLLGGRDAISERALRPILRKLTTDATVKAVVLRIDSPGGSAVASDLLWKQLMRLRASKKLVVSVGEMAASGGYYLASAAEKS